MGDELTLRAAAAEDREFLFRVYASTRTEELAQVEWSEEQKDEFLRMQFDAQSRFYEANYPGARFDVILCGGTPAGRLYVVRWENEIRIMDIALLPAYRGRGLGGALLGQIQAEGRASNLPVTIHVERFNPALRLYTRLGFREIEDKGVYLLLEWTPDAG